MLFWSRCSTTTGQTIPLVSTADVFVCFVVFCTLWVFFFIFESAEFNTFFLSFCCLVFCCLLVFSYLLPSCVFCLVTFYLLISSHVLYFLTSCVVCLVLCHVLFFRVSCRVVFCVVFNVLSSRVFTFCVLTCLRCTSCLVFVLAL